MDTTRRKIACNLILKIVLFREIMGKTIRPKATIFLKENLTQ
jgi:hypothetical protein